MERDDAATCTGVLALPIAKANWSEKLTPKTVTIVGINGSSLSVYLNSDPIVPYARSWILNPYVPSSANRSLKPLRP